MTSDGRKGLQFQYNLLNLEEQVTGNLNLLDYGARMYDSEVGRWFVMDPLAEKYYSLSPYDFVGGNPVNRVDPNGMDWYELIKDKDEKDEDELNGPKKPQYMFTTEYRSQADLDKAGVKGTYIGLTDKKGGKYLSLLGEAFDLKNADGSSNHIAKMAENLDAAIDNLVRD